MNKFLIPAALLLLIGCRAANVATFEQRSVVGITSANFGEYVIPVISIGQGPSAYVYQSRDRASRIEIEGHAVTTNETSALGMYSNKEVKYFDFKGAFDVFATNVVENAVSTNIVVKTEEK